MKEDISLDDETYYKYSKNQIYDNLNTSEEGLTNKEAEKRLEKFGPNELEEKKKKSLFKMFIRQFTDVLTLVLIAAIVISLIIFFIDPADQESLIDASVIFAILIVNAIIGVRQEYKSEKALEALKKLSAPEATVVRAGKMTKIPSREVVPGDYVVLQTGDKVVADLRLIKAMNLKIDESMLTGESVAVTKKDEVIDEDKVPVSERKNIAHSGTIITYGGGEGVVFKTGMKTEMGKIADLIQSAEEKKTPLQRDLAKLSKWLTLLIVIICVVVFITGIIEQAIYTGSPPDFTDYEEMFLSAVGLAVAAIPEGLPAIVTIALSIGVSRMVEKNAIIRRLNAVETLGCATVICSDKTGTLTQNEMTIRKVYTNDNMISVSGIGYEPKGEFKIDDKKTEMKKDPHLQLLCRIGILCSDAELNYNEEEKKWDIFGDPTEASLLVLGGKIDMWKKDLLKKYPKKNVLPFDSTRKMMTTVHNTPDNKSYAYVKGAPEQILDRCIKKFVNETEKELSEDYKEKILDINEDMTKDALRTLAIAYREVDLDTVSIEEMDSEHIEKNMIFVGLVGMIDPPREESKYALQECKNAGMRAVIITGDHKLTAQAIAKELNMMEKDDIAITGSEINEMSDNEFNEIVEKVKVFARVSPEHKVKVCTSLQAKRNVVAMTGDGVNDSPAIKAADIGVAMGIAGTEVTKEAADMTLMDDNFATIVNAVREGRGIYDNIRKFIFYLLSSNIGEILTLFVAILIGFQAGGELVLPLVPVQILWINLVTDGLPATALSVEPKDPDIMKRLPRDPKEPIINRKMAINMVLVGLVMMVGTLLMFQIGLSNLYGLAESEYVTYARTLSFTTLMMFQMFNVISCRSFKQSIFKLKKHNRALYLAILSSVILQIMVVYVPGIQLVFYCTGLYAIDWLWLVLVSSSVLLTNEVYKWIIRKRQN